VSARRAATAALLATLAAAAAAEWPQFRGAGGGHADADGLPLTWSEDENVAWKVAVPGRGHSSPVVLGGQVWITAAREEERSLRAVAVDAASGAVLFDLEVFRPAAWQASHLENSYASPTPAIEPGRVYVHFGTYGTACLDTEGGRVLWTSDELRLDHEMGPGSSPILWRDLLIVNCDGTDRRYVAALDKHSGRIAWRSRRSVPVSVKRGTHRKAYSTPIVVDVGGQAQLVTAGADQVSALDPATGREIWRVVYEGYSVVPQPVAGNGRVYVDTGYVQPHLLAIRLGGHGDVTESHVEWSYYWQVPANPTPLVIGERIFMVNDQGNATWLDAGRGEDLWRRRLGGRHWASPLHAAGRIYTWSANGETVVVAADDVFRELARNRLDAEVRATPAVAGDAFFVRGATHLYRLEELAPAPRRPAR